MLVRRRRKAAGRIRARSEIRSGGRRHRAVRFVRLGQDLDRQHDRGADRAGPRAHRARRHRAVRQRNTHQRAGAPPPHRLRVPGGAAVPASHRGAESRLRPLDERCRGRPRRARAHRRAARHRPPHVAPAGQAVRRRATARRVRPRAADASRGSSCSTSRSPRSTAPANSKSCRIWRGCATKPKCR